MEYTTHYHFPTTEYCIVLKQMKNNKELLFKRKIITFQTRKWGKAMEVKKRPINLAYVTNIVPKFTADRSSNQA